MQPRLWTLSKQLDNDNNNNNNNNITEDTREATVLFQRLSVALQRGNAVSFHNTIVTE